MAMRLEIDIPLENLPFFLQPGVLERPMISEAESDLLKGQVVVAPGGSRGIGKAFIIKVAEYGASVVTGRVNESARRKREMGEVLAEVEAWGGLARAVYGDLRDSSVQDAYVEAALGLMRKLGVERVHTFYPGPAAGATSLGHEDAEKYARELNAVAPAQLVDRFRKSGIEVGGIAYPASTLSHGLRRVSMPPRYVLVAQYKHEGAKRLAETGVPLYIACGHAVKGTFIIDKGLAFLEPEYPGYTEALMWTSIGGKFATAEDMADALTASRLSGSNRVVFVMGEGEWGYAPSGWVEEYYNYLNQQFERFGFPMPSSQKID